MKIVHISDLHIGYNKNGCDCKKRSDKLIGEIIKRCTPADDYIVVITGDIVNKGKNYQEMKDAKVILDKLVEAHLKVRMVPGNHDYGKGNYQDEKHQKKFKEIFFGDEQFAFPSCEVINDTAFIGLDSLQGEFDRASNSPNDANEGPLTAPEDYDWGKEADPKAGPDGSIGKKQLNDLKKVLNKPEVLNAKYRVVYLHHHPFWNSPLWISALHDKKALGKVLREHDIDLLLFGHKHSGKVCKEGHWGIPRIFDGGSSVGKKSDPTPIRVIDLEKPPGQYQEWHISL